MRRKLWKLSACDKDSAAQLAESCNLDPFLALLLTARGIADEIDAESYLCADFDFSDPFEYIDMEKAVARISAALDRFEKIAVFGDYDADGVTSAALLYAYLEKRGADVVCRIPDRMTEGYGISEAAVRELAADGVKLIVTVDNGISAVKPAEVAKSLGVDMVITDHHQPGERLPEAAAVVDPHRSDCPSEFKDFAGVGVAFKLVCAMESDFEAICADFADLVAVGTLADAVPLRGENRALVRLGLRHINAAPRIGIEALKAAAGVQGKTLSAANVAFTLAPRINAVGRLGSAMPALQLLLCDDPDTAAQIAEETDRKNKQRQAIEAEIFKEAVEQIESDPEIRYASILTVAGEGWHPGVIGIVAARLVSRYGKPAVVISTDGDIGKGSCRSVEDFSIYDALCAVSAHLTHFGGHPGAAGLGVETAHIPALRKALDTYAKSVDMPFAYERIDFKLNPAYINLSLLETLAALEPFGTGNPVPTFGLYRMKLVAAKPVGEGRHLRLTLEKGLTQVTAMLFSVTPAQFPFRCGDTVDLAVQVEKNEFRGEIKPSVRIREMRFSDSDEENLFKSVRLYEKYRYRDALTQKEIAFLTPSREFLLGVYRFLKSNEPFAFDVEVFCRRSGCPYAHAATALVAFDVLEELGLIQKDANGGFCCPKQSGKADLTASEILKQLSQKGA